MSHLFKLKKDGKDAGYLRITCNAVMYKNKTTYGQWLFTHSAANLEEPSFDTAHPFVCKDKDNKDVFANSLVWFRWMGKKIKAKVVKDDLFIHLVSCEGEKRGLPRTLCTSDISHIEIITELKQ